MSTNQPRRPAGTPQGGQWAPATHAEAEDVALGEKLREKLDAPSDWWRQHIVVTKVAGRTKKNDN